MADARQSDRSDFTVLQNGYNQKLLPQRKNKSQDWTISMKISNLQKVYFFLLFASSHEGGGVTSIHAGTGCAIFGLPFFRYKINLGDHFC